VRDAGERNLLAEHRPARDAHLVTAERTQQVLELGQQPLVGLGVVVGLGEVDVPLAVDADAVLRAGEVLAGEPEVDGVPGDVVEREAGREPGRGPAQDVAI
jgi:hypothetical protein